MFSSESVYPMFPRQSDLHPLMAQIDASTRTTWCRTLWMWATLRVYVVLHTVMQSLGKTPVLLPMLLLVLSRMYLFASLLGLIQSEKLGPLFKRQRSARKQATPVESLPSLITPGRPVSAPMAVGLRKIPMRDGTPQRQSGRGRVLVSVAQHLTSLRREGVKQQGGVVMMLMVLYPVVRLVSWTSLTKVALAMLISMGMCFVIRWYISLMNLQCSWQARSRVLFAALSRKTVRVLLVMRRLARCMVFLWLSLLLFPSGATTGGTTFRSPAGRTAKGPSDPQPTCTPHRKLPQLTGKKRGYLLTSRETLALWLGTLSLMTLGASMTWTSPTGRLPRLTPPTSRLRVLALNRLTGRCMQVMVAPQTLKVLPSLK